MLKHPSEKICDYNRLKSRNLIDQIGLTIRLKIRFYLDFNLQKINPS